jgi:hypothetical protein
MIEYGAQTLKPDGQVKKNQFAGFGY